MFSFRGKEAPPLQLYGKLPIAKDYLRVGCGSEAGRRLREWLDRGFSSEVEGAAPLLPHALRFLWVDRTGQALQGMLRPSSDAGGLRPFPLVVFVERRARVLAEERAKAGAGDEGWWRALEQCHAELGAFREGSELLEALRGRKVTRSELAGDAPESPGVDFETWAAALWPGEGGPGYERLLRELVASSREPAGILRLPLAWGNAMPVQVSAWMRVLAEMGWAGGRTAPTIFYPSLDSPGPVPAWLLVMPKTPEPGEVSWLLPTSRAPAGPGGPAAVLPAAAPASKPPTSLADALCSALGEMQGRT